MPTDDDTLFDQVTNNVSNLKELVREHHTDAYVDGLIVVVPAWEATITLDVESPRHGCGVVLGSTPGELCAWLHRTSNRKLLFWTAEAVHALLTDLKPAEMLTVEDLLVEGFPSATGRRAAPRRASHPPAAREAEQAAAVPRAPPFRRAPRCLDCRRLLDRRSFEHRRSVYCCCRSGVSEHLSNPGRHPEIPARPVPALPAPEPEPEPEPAVAAQITTENHGSPKRCCSGRERNLPWSAIRRG